MLQVEESTLKDCIIGQSDHDGSGWIAVYDGQGAALAHCCCLGYGVWKSLVGDGSAGPGWDWEGTLDELAEMAARGADPDMPDRQATGIDCEHLMRVYAQVTEFVVNGRMPEDVHL